MVKNNNYNYFMKLALEEAIISFNEGDFINVDEELIRFDNKPELINSTKIRKELNWRHNVSLSEGLNKTFLWYYNNQKYFKNLKEKDITKRLGT